METIINLLPCVYMYWASALIIWSIVVCGMLGKIIHESKRCHHIWFYSDVLIFASCAIGAILLFVSVFVIPQVTVLFIELALLLSLWYTMFLGVANHTNILTWIEFCRRSF